MKHKHDQIDHTLFLNRELSQLQFTYRVLMLVQDKKIPLLERLRFLFICCMQLDEFFEVRVAGVKEMAASFNPKLSIDGLTSAEVLTAVSLKAHKLVQELYSLWQTQLLPDLAIEKIQFIDSEHWNKKIYQWCKDYFHHEIMPLLSPVALDMAHPFPKLVNKSLNFMVTIKGQDAFHRDSDYAIIPAPRSLPRVIKLPKEIMPRGDHFVMLASIIEAFAKELFYGMDVTGCYQFRLTRNSDLLVDEEAVEDLAVAVKSELFARRYGSAVRLEVAANCPEEVAGFLLNIHHLTEEDLYYCDGPVNLGRYIAILDLIKEPSYYYPEYKPIFPKVLLKNGHCFSIIKKQDVLLYHPYESFEAVGEFIRQAASDPSVVVIKQTLYRTRPDSTMVTALVDAARSGKEVTAVIELRARFDEEHNIELANRLQQAGVLIVYGVVKFKTHAKMTLVVRREDHGLQNYVHLGTGNYHERTAKQYTDFGLLTADPVITHDVHKVFQQLTGTSQILSLKKLWMAPFNLYAELINLLKFEKHEAQQGRTALVLIKVNGLTDPAIIQELYRASQAGVTIQLIVRGLCCLKPGLPGISDNITVRSVVGRFLEHARIFYFYHGGDEKIYLASSDLMERNLYHRVEVAFPIEDKQLAKRIKELGLDPYFKETQQAYELKADGDYQLVKKATAPSFSAQEFLLQEFLRREN